MTAETVILGARVVTMTGPAQNGSVQALALDRGRIMAVDTEEEVSSLIGSGTQVIRLEGRTILPGFIDTHVHLTQIGLADLGPGVFGLTSPREVLDFIRAEVKGRSRQELVMVYGCWLNGLEGPLGSTELDQAAPDNPLMILDPGGHACLINTAARELLGLAPDTPGLVQPSAHSFQGALVGRANALARHLFYGLAVSDRQRAEAQQRAADMGLARGVTTIHALEGGAPDGWSGFAARDVEVLLEQQSKLPLETLVYYQGVEVQKVLDWGLPRIGGCLLLDGSYGEHTTALREPYTDDPGTRGVLYFSDRELSDFVGQAHRAGLQISMHAIGDAAIGQFLGAMERAQKEFSRKDPRHRIEHFSLPTLEQIRWAADLGVAAAMQPNFAAMPPAGKDGVFRVAGLKQLGPERTRRRHPYRWITDAGVLVAGGSGTKPMDPLEGVQALAAHPEEERHLSAYEALALYTVNAARLGFEEHEKGTIEPGKQADLAVLDKNPLTVAVDQLAGIKVEMTLVKGRIHPGILSA